jgi:uncharacterized protein (DUF433 family)
VRKTYLPGAFGWSLVAGHAT